MGHVLLVLIIVWLRSRESWSMKSARGRGSAPPLGDSTSNLTAEKERASELSPTSRIVTRGMPPATSSRAVGSCSG
jgi:hypothetical protein